MSKAQALIDEAFPGEPASYYVASYWVTIGHGTPLTAKEAMELAKRLHSEMCEGTTVR